jgi:siroheme synthase (precorrin-2 oxidase/ferrochelatase)
MNDKQWAEQRKIEMKEDSLEGVYWNYRVVEYPPFKPTNEKTFMIHEVYYRKDKIVAYSTNGMAPHGTTAEELKRDLEKMVAAYEKPVLKLSKMQKEIEKNRHKEKKK